MAGNTNKTVLSGLAGALLIAAGLTASFEGKSNTAYLDPPGVPTICYGHAQGVSLGRTATDQECVFLLKQDLEVANATVTRYVKVPLPDTRRAALIDFVYNVGSGKFAKSHLLKKLNSGDTLGACTQLLRWTGAGKVVLAGLVRRRQAEYDLCVKGISP